MTQLRREETLAPTCANRIKVGKRVCNGGLSPLSSFLILLSLSHFPQLPLMVISGNSLRLTALLTTFLDSNLKGTWEGYFMDGILHSLSGQGFDVGALGWGRRRVWVVYMFILPGFISACVCIVLFLKPITNNSNSLCS